MCVCVCACLWVSVGVCLWVCASVGVCACMSDCVRTHARVCVCLLINFNADQFGERNSAHDVLSNNHQVLFVQNRSER